LGQTLTGIGEISAEIRPTGLTSPLLYFSVKRSVASAITIVLLVTLSLDATVDAGDAIICVPSNRKGEAAAALVVRTPSLQSC
jgi:hypothetical protein